MIESGPDTGRPAPMLFVDATRMPADKSLELCREARRLSWNLMTLEAGDDYPEIDSAAAEHVAGAVAFAGPDTSQAKAVAVAAGRELPYACVPSGRNDLFARDLGVDPDDGLRSLSSSENVAEFYVDLAEVNGSLFVNYVALGLDCTPVRPSASADQRALMFTSAPVYLLARRQPPGRLHWFPDGKRESCEGVFVSNNCRRFESRAVSGRTRLDGGVLGIGILTPIDWPARPERFARWQVLDSHTFEVDSSAPVNASVDGRPVRLEPPVRFRILPRALLVRVLRAA